MNTILLCLHGWGGSKESFMELRYALKDASIEILTPDLPGFGTESEPDRPWNTDDYADWVLRWMKNQKPETSQPAEALAKVGNQKLFLLGHSHGGRIAMKLSARQSNDERRVTNDVRVSHLYLCAAAGIRHPRHFKRILGLTLAKTGKFFLAIPGLRLLRPLGRRLLYRLVRVHDYEKASPVMQQTLMKVSEEDLRPLLAQIHVPTDIFWGTDDHMTPVADAHVIHEGIVGSRLHLFKGVRHGVHRERAGEIAGVIAQNLFIA